MPVCVFLILWLGVSREQGRFGKVCHFRLAGFVALWLVGFVGEVSYVVCRQHFIAGLYLNMFGVCFFFFKEAISGLPQDVLWNIILI